MRAGPRRPVTGSNPGVTPDVLGEGLEHRSLDALLEIFRGVAADEVPAWVTPLLGEATVSAIDALRAVSTRCEVMVPSRQHDLIGFSAHPASRTVWIACAPAQRRPNVSVSGRMDLVDLRMARFRVRDACGSNGSRMPTTRPGPSVSW